MPPTSLCKAYAANLVVLNSTPCIVDADVDFDVGLEF